MGPGVNSIFFKCITTACIDLLYVKFIEIDLAVFRAGQVENSCTYIGRDKVAQNNAVLSSPAPSTLGALLGQSAA